MGLWRVELNLEELQSHKHDQVGSQQQRIRYPVVFCTVSRVLERRHSAIERERNKITFQRIWLWPWYWCARRRKNIFIEEYFIPWKTVGQEAFVGISSPRPRRKKSNRYILFVNQIKKSSRSLLIKLKTAGVVGVVDFLPFDSFQSVFLLNVKKQRIVFSPLRTEEVDRTRQTLQTALSDS